MIIARTRSGARRESWSTRWSPSTLPSMPPVPCCAWCSRSWRWSCSRWR